MAGTKRKKEVTNAKTSAHSKQHKSAAKSSKGTGKKSASATASGTSAGSAARSNFGGSSTVSKKTSSAFVDVAGGGGKKRHGAAPVRDAYGQTKKERKGKGPAYIPVVRAQDSDDDQDDSDDASEDDDDDDGAMEVDDDLADQDALGSAAAFLTRLDEKGMSASRPSLVEAYRKEKPAPQQRNKANGITANIRLPAPAPLKSELKAQKAQANKLKKLAKKNKAAGGSDDDDQDPVDSGDEDDDLSTTNTPRKAHPEGELVDDLESDDLAFGSGSDDDLSTMSELESMSDMSDMSEMSDLGSDFDEDDEELEDDEAFSDEAGSQNEPAFDSNEELEWSDEQDGSALGTGAESDSVVDTDGELDDSSEDEDSLADDESGEDSDLDANRPIKRKRLDPEGDDLEAAYEARPAAPKVAKSRPTKLPTVENGRVVRTAEPLDSQSPSPSPEPTPEPQRQEAPYRSDPLGQRFGRPAVRQLLEIKNKKERVKRAREEIADLGREASGTGEGEGGLNLLKRLMSLTAPKFHSSSSAKSAGEKPIMVDREIRIMAMVSLLAVFIDVVPGYRIRELTAAEKEVKVSQLVARQREWEDGLVGVYKRFLEVCESEITEDSPLAPAAVHCLCTLVKEKPEFNFAVNIMDVVVKRMGRKGWDESHQMCLETVNYVFIHDTTTTASNSLHLVRLISRLVRARSFAIRPEVLSALLNLRLKEELGGGRLRASADRVYREKEGRKGTVNWKEEKNHRGRKGGKAKAAMSKKGSKKARVALKEAREIEKEMREAEGEINAEERERNQTETLKLLFALYFRIVKLDYRSPLLPAALEGLARFAHLVNIDFFRDLLEVLKGIIKRGDVVEAEEVEAEIIDVDAPTGLVRRNDMREKLLCIVAAFELLQGQGEALTIDLGDFISALYALILPLALSPTFEETPYLGRNAVTNTNKVTAKLAQTEADLLFRALAAIFLTPRSLPSAVRTLAFSKRLMTSSLQWPPASQLRTLVFLRSLLIREPKLEAMLETGDRRIDGKWRGHVDEPERAEPEGTCWWEADLYRLHPDEKIRIEAKKLLNYKRDA